MYVGVVVSTFNEQKEKLGKNFLLTETQKQWINMKLKLLNSKPYIKKMSSSKNKYRILAFKISRSKKFENFISAVIVFNCLILMINWYDMPG